MARCQHRNSWLISHGSYEWCYQCGAIRSMRETGIAQVTPTSPWCSPTGPNGQNPWDAWDKLRTRYRERRQRKDVIARKRARRLQRERAA